MFRVSATLSRALDAVLDGLPADALRRATASLIDVYRSGAPPAAQVLRDPTTAAAYAAYRMPATHAAVSRALRHATSLDPGLDVRSVVDVGGGTGAATWAVAEAFPGLERATVLDGSADAWPWGSGSPGTARGPCPRRPVADAAGAGCRSAGGGSGGVSYALGELPDALHAPVVDAPTSAARLALVIEPGTPRGYAAVLAARSRLTGAGWHLLAPCPQDGPCPVAGATDWCHSRPGSTGPGCTAGSRAASAGTRTRSSPTCWPRATRWLPRTPACSGIR